MADRRPRSDPPAARNGRGDAARGTDHAAIDRLADDLLPALVAKLGASGLAEIEVREGAWSIRLRRPSGGPNLGRRATDGPSRQQPGHAGHGHAPAAVEGHRSVGARDGFGPLAAVGPGRPSGPESERSAQRHRAVATSPAVGIFQPRPEMRPGTRVRAGDRLAFVDVLGVRQEVVSPVDGIVGATLAEAGDAVEYGQELVRLELAGQPTAGTGPASATSTGPAGSPAVVDQRTIDDVGPSAPAPGSGTAGPSLDQPPAADAGTEGDA
jgi:biotin carboxyl carrier protein